MAKTDINKLTGRIGQSLYKQRRNRLELVFYEIDKEEKRASKPEIKPGPRAKFMAAYRVVGFEEAKNCINKGLKKEVYNNDILNKWIEEERQ